MAGMRQSGRDKVGRDKVGRDKVPELVVGQALTRACPTSGEFGSFVANFVDFRLFPTKVCDKVSDKERVRADEASALLLTLRRSQFVIPFRSGGLDRDRARRRRVAPRPNQGICLQKPVGGVAPALHNIRRVELAPVERGTPALRGWRVAHDLEIENNIR